MCKFDGTQFCCFADTLFCCFAGTLFCCFTDTLFYCFTDTLFSIWIYNTELEMKHGISSIYLQFAADRLNPCIASINMKLYESMIYT